MNVIVKSSISEEFSLSKKYENYTDVFLTEKTMKHNELEDVKHSINLISEKDLSYELIYNLFV